MGYTQVEYLKKYNKNAYENKLRRDGIIVSVTNLIPNGEINFIDIDENLLNILEYVNENYGKLNNDGIDDIHRELLNMFDDPGELKKI